jgi:hypothetical protein
MQIIIMGVDWVLLHSFCPKHSPVIQIRSAAGAEYRSRFPFFDRRVPEIEPELRRTQRALRSFREVIALLDKEDCRSADY